MKYGYPFYTLPCKAYVSVTSQWEKEVSDVASEIAIAEFLKECVCIEVSDVASKIEEIPLESIAEFLKERGTIIEEELKTMIEENLG